MKKNIENSDMPISRPTTFEPRSVRRRKIENGTSGWGERVSMAAKMASSEREAACHRDGAGDVEVPRLVLVAALVEQARRQRGGGEPDRHVDEEHPLPA